MQPLYWTKEPMYGAFKNGEGSGAAKPQKSTPMHPPKPAANPLAHWQGAIKSIL
jgi:hypothetical protein